MDAVRLTVVVSIVILNFLALFRLCFRSPYLCLHNILTMAVILANILYLMTCSSVFFAESGWPWTLMSEQVYCLSQNYMVNAMSMVLMGLLTLRCVDKIRQIFFGDRRFVNNMVLVLVVWILPQLVYDLISLVENRQSCQHPVFNVFTSLQLAEPSRKVSLTIGGGTFLSLICEEEMNVMTVNVHAWQYTILVIPCAVISILCAVIITGVSVFGYTRQKSLKYTMWITNPQDKEFTCEESLWCHQQQCVEKMTVVDVILTFNLLWQLIGRPLMLTRALHGIPSPVFLDVGSNLMLTISSIFIPMFWLFKEIKTSPTYQRCVALTSSSPVTVHTIDGQHVG